MFQSIENWFVENKRDFPWRKDHTPYRVWISEVMLQQTRAATVVPYFERWMELFPDVKVLYNAPIEQVIKAWEGLGYYSRARNLHRGAKQIVEQFHGEIPKTREELLSIRGFGSYTVGALLSFAFHIKAAAVDGNVLRVVSRLFCIEENISKTSTRRNIEKKAESLLDPETPWITAEALIELGSTVCTKKPRCEICPLQHKCLSLQQGKETSLPIKNEQKKIIDLFRSVLVLEFEGSVLIRKGVLGKVMADLYEFPYLESPKKFGLRQEILAEANRLCGSSASFVRNLTPCSHTFTSYKAHLFPQLLQMNRCTAIIGFEWVAIDQLNRLPFSSGHRKIVTEVEKIYSQR